MTVEFKLPELGENVESGDVVNVLVKVGDTIDIDQPVLELETDKAVLEVPSDVKGTVKEVLVKEGDQAGPGQVVLIIDDNGSAAPDDSAPAASESEPEAEEASASEAEPEPEPEAEPEPAEESAAPAASSKGTPALIEVKVPELGENVEAGDVIAVLVEVGDTIEVDQAIVELETDKAVLEVPSDIAGVVKELLVKAGDQAGPGQGLLMVETSDAGQSAAPAPKNDAPAKTEEKPAEETDSSASEAAPAPAQKAEAPAAPSSNGQGALLQSGEKLYELAPAAPSVRRFARELGVDVHYISGTGPNGRISRDDVKAYVKSITTKASPAAAVTAAAPGIVHEPLPDFSKWGEVERERMSNIRRATAQHLSFAWATIPHVTQHDKTDITELEKLRKQYGKVVEDAGGKLTPTAIILKVVAAALKKFPQFNASIDMENREVIYKKYIHIGIAVDTPRGLLVPVIRDVDQKNLVEISLKLGEVAQKARDRKLSLEEMQGGTFSVSNLGGIGGTSFTPIINSPEVAILGIARGRMEPVWIDGKFEPRMMMPLSLSYDHRLIDGADGARFIRWVAEALEQPFKLMVEG